MPPKSCPGPLRRPRGGSPFAFGGMFTPGAEVVYRCIYDFSQLIATQIATLQTSGQTDEVPYMVPKELIYGTKVKIFS